MAISLNSLKPAKGSTHKKKMISSNSCWQNAYQHLFAGCSEILAVDEKRSRLAWHLSDCFQRDSGRSPFPHCDPKSSIAVCSRSLDDLAHKVYLEFYLETNTICYQLQLSAISFPNSSYFFSYLCIEDGPYTLRHKGILLW